MNKSQSLFQVLYTDLRCANISPSFGKLLLKFFSDPNFQTIFYFRLSLWAIKRGKLGWLIAKLCWKRNIYKSSCHLSFFSSVGSGLKFPHACGIVIGDNTLIGNNVTIYQNVTIGKKDNDSLNYPIIGNNSIIYTGACLLGEISTGVNCIVAANAVLLRSMPENSMAAGIPAKIYKQKIK